MIKKGSIKLTRFHGRPLSGLFSARISKQFVRYLITGISAALLEYLIFNILFFLTKALYVSNTAGMTAGLVLSFALNRVWSFESRGRIDRQLVMYIALFIVNLLISNYAIHILADVIGILPALSKAMVMGMIVIWNFVIYRKVIYR